VIQTSAEIPRKDAEINNEVCRGQNPQGGLQRPAKREESLNILQKEADEPPGIALRRDGWNASFHRDLETFSYDDSNIGYDRGFLKPRGILA
jgi:hypothetical protein